MDLWKLKLELIEQKKSKFKGNIYHFSQVNFAYNSNKIEGGRLTEDETEYKEEFNTEDMDPQTFELYCILMLIDEYEKRTR